MKKLTFAAAAFAVASFGMLTTACQNKNNSESESDSMVVESTFTETPATDSEVAAAESSLAVVSQEQKVESETKAPVATDGYKTTKSGLKYRVVKPGTGRIPNATNIVEVNYEGRLMDGTLFDSSYERGESVEFPLNRVISGWTEGLQLMREGSIYEFIIPSELAYGKSGAGSMIPPDATLYFKVELIKIK